ncbi:MAG: amino acid permease, partial [Gemmatimonadales bacterium]
MGFFSTKNVSDLQAEAEGSQGLKRALTATNLVFLGIGAIIGAGIFVLTGQVAAIDAGPAVVLSFVLAGSGCLFAGLCYAEFASMIPIAGSAYTYGYATMGELIAWIIGWDLILEYLFGASTVAVGWSGYFSAFMDQIGFHMPTSFTSSPYYYADANEFDPITKVLLHPAGFSHTGAVLNLPAMILIGLMTTLLVIGIKESARFNNFIVILKVTIVLLVIGFGFMYVNTANWHP